MLSPVPLTVNSVHDLLTSVPVLIEFLYRLLIFVQPLDVCLLNIVHVHYRDTDPTQMCISFRDSDMHHIYIMENYMCCRGVDFSCLKGGWLKKIMVKKFNP